MIRIPHLETDVTQACQLSCVACNHSVPLWRQKGPWTAKPAQVEKDLNHLAAFLHADKWGALGGEPLLNKQLVDILRVARASRIADVIEVWTNGLDLPRQSPAFWRSFDHLVVSIYPGVLSDDDVNWIEQKCAVEGVVFSPRDERKAPNFKTMLEPVPTSPEATKRKFDGCFFRSFSRCASYGYFFTCCCGPHIPMLVQGREFGADGVRIEGSTEADIHAYLTRAEPLGACYDCAGRDTAVSIPWSQERKPLEWLAKSAGVRA